MGIQEFGSEDRVIAVMGATGAGKSTFVHAATGDKSIEVGYTLQSSYVHRVQVDDMQVVLLDTPGFNDTYRDDADVLREIADWLATNYVEGHQLTAILYLHRITDVRITGSARRNLRVFKKLIGDFALSNVVLVTTMWDGIEQAIGVERERELVSNSLFWGDMVRAGSTVARFDKTRECAYNIIRLRLKTHTRILTIQEEMVDDKTTLAETGAGKEVLAEMTKLKFEHQKEMSQLRSDMKEALDKHDEAAAKDLTEVSKRYRDEIAGMEAQINALQSRSPETEALQIRHEQELKSLRDTLEDRMSFLEEQASVPPPSYVEAKMTSEENVPTPTQSAASHNTKMSQSIVLRIWTLFIWLRRLVRLILRPRVPAGYRRLEWTCSCGELLYGDFKESSPGSSGELATKLREQSGRGASQSSSPQSSGEPRNMTEPPKLHLRQSIRPTNWNSHGDGDQEDPSDPRNQTFRGTARDRRAPIRENLQLCIETGKYSLEIEEVGLDRPQSDGILFQSIRERYEHIRHSVLPMRLRFSKPNKAIFVKCCIQFRLGQHPFVSPIAGSIDAPSIPPKDEVTAGNYVYNPCPIDEPPIDNRTFFHHFYSPASLHPYMMWGPRIPRKLGRSLTPMAQGWGIHLEECPDWPLFAAVNFISLLISGAIAGIYSWKTKDTQTGVAIGTWLTAVQVMGMTAIFFWWH
ncbi:MAG: hypothetical protein Q9214_004423 [Letrouitia sp. 1 TL-2023]